MELSDGEKIIIEFLEINKKVTSKKVGELLNVKSARARRVLQEMLKKNLINRQGKSVNTHYIIKE